MALVPVLALGLGWMKAMDLAKALDLAKARDRALGLDWVTVQDLEKGQDLVPELAARASLTVKDRQAGEALALDLDSSLSATLKSQSKTAQLRQPQAHTVLVYCTTLEQLHWVRLRC